MAIEAITLGLDDILFDTEDTHLEACNAAFSACGLTLRWGMPQLRKALRMRGAANAVAAALDGIAAPQDADVQRLVQEKNRLYLEMLTALRPLPHAGYMKLIDDAHASGCKLAIVTGMPALTTSTLLDMAFGAEATSTFTAVVSAADFDGSGENAPHTLALRTVGVEAENCVAIHTAPPALRAAQRAGIWTISVMRYEKDISRINGADLWCPQLQELQHLIGKRSLRAERPQGFITFDGLHDLKERASCDLPTSHQQMQYRQSA